MLTPKWRGRARPVSPRAHSARGPSSFFWRRSARLLDAVFGVAFRVLRYFRSVQDIGNLLAAKVLGVHPAGVPLDSAALQHHHRAVDVFSGARTSTCSCARRSTGSGSTSPSSARRWCTRHGWWRCWRCRSSPRTASCYRGGPLFPFVALAAFVPFLLLPAVVGTIVTRGRWSTSFPRAARASCWDSSRSGRWACSCCCCDCIRPGAARAARGLPQLRRLPRGAAHADQPVPAERVDGRR